MGRRGSQKWWGGCWVPRALAMRPDAPIGLYGPLRPTTASLRLCVPDENRPIYPASLARSRDWCALGERAQS